MGYLIEFLTDLPPWFLAILLVALVFVGMVVVALWDGKEPGEFIRSKMTMEARMNGLWWYITRF